jgi:regulator of ribonuclease activity A
VLGGNLGALAVKNQWVGLVIYGCIRDSEEIAGQPVGVKALAVHPRKSEKGLHSAHADRVVSFAGATFQPGAWLYADADGIVVSDKPLHA